MMKHALDTPAGLRQHRAQAVRCEVPEVGRYLKRVPVLLEELKLELTMSPRLARRLRALAHQEKCSVSRLVTMILERSLVPDEHERRRLAERGLEDALSLIVNAMPAEEQV